MKDTLTIPDDLVYLVLGDQPAHISALRDDGSIATYLMWVDWDGEHLLTSSPVGSRKAAHWQRNPQVGMSVVDREDQWRYVILRGRVTNVRPDTDLAFIDKMSLRYTGQHYRWRDSEREVFEITPDYIRASPGRGGRR